MIGSLIAVPATLAAILSGGGGHSSYVAARVLFPYAMLLTLLEGSIGPLAISAALVQFPLYGALIGSAPAPKRLRSAVVVAAAHLTVALACFSALLANFA